MMASTGKVPREALWPLLAGVQGTQLLYVAAKLGLADQLADGPLGADELARRTATHPGALHRSLRGLVVAGVLAELDDGRFGLKPLGEHLQADAPGGMRDWAIVAGELHAVALGGLLHSVRTGEPGLAHTAGVSLWEHLRRTPELAAAFDRLMTRNSEELAGALLAAYEMTGLRWVVDVGGGQGALAAALVRAVPGLTATVLDTEHGLAGAPALLAGAGVADRCMLVTGDFFRAVPAGADAYLLKNVLHDWDDEHARQILARCCAAMGVGARLLIVELLLPRRVEELPWAIQVDLQVLAGAGGRKRTEAEYRALLGLAGLELVASYPLSVLGWRVLEAGVRQSGGGGDGH
jgi:hypothetical protein